MDRLALQTAQQEDIQGRSDALRLSLDKLRERTDQVVKILASRKPFAQSKRSGTS